MIKLELTPVQISHIGLALQLQQAQIGELLQTIQAQAEAQVKKSEVSDAALHD